MAPPKTLGKTGLVTDVTLVTAFQDPSSVFRFGSPFVALVTFCKTAESAGALRTLVSFCSRSFSLARLRVQPHVQRVTLLQERDQARRERRLQAHSEVRAQLRAALASLIPGHKVVVFGSLTKPGVFNDRSDVDIALEAEPSGMSSWRLAGELMEKLGRPVDVVLLGECRFREKILREGETWTV